VFVFQEVEHDLNYESSERMSSAIDELFTHNLLNIILENVNRIM